MILIIDFETTGVDVATCEPIEFAYIICDDNLNFLMSSSHLIKSTSPVNKEITDLTGITNEMLNFAISPKDLTLSLFPFLQGIKTIIAHNGLNFDFKILERIGVDLTGKTLIDTLIHLPFKDSTTSKRLNHLCADYGIYFQDGHRALSDCLALLSLLKKFDFQDVLNRAKSKVLNVVANVSFDKKEIVKKQKFQWLNSKWQKQVLECDLAELKETLLKDGITLEVIQ